MKRALTLLISPEYASVCEAWQAGIESNAACNATSLIYNDAVAFPGAMVSGDAFWNGCFAITKKPNDDFPMEVTDRCISIVQTNDTAMVQSILPVFTEVDGKTYLEELTFSTCAGGVCLNATSGPVNVEFAILGNPTKLALNEN